MKVLIINCILTTAEHGIIKRKETIGDCMISNFARGFIELGHTVTLLASEDFRPTGNDERLPFKVVYFPSRLPQVFKPSLLPWPKGMHRWLKAHADAYDLVIASPQCRVLHFCSSGRRWTATSGSCSSCRPSSGTMRLCRR